MLLTLTPSGAPLRAAIMRKTKDFAEFQSRETVREVIAKLCSGIGREHEGLPLRASNSKLKNFSNNHKHARLFDLNVH